MKCNGGPSIILGTKMFLIGNFGLNSHVFEMSIVKMSPATIDEIIITLHAKLSSNASLHVLLASLSLTCN